MSSPFIPGPCGPTGCPPPTELVCMKTKKIFQECRHTWVPNSVTFTVPEEAGLVIATGVTCGPVFVEPSFLCENQLVPCTTAAPGTTFVPGHKNNGKIHCECVSCVGNACPPTVTPDISATASGQNLCTTEQFPIPTCPPIFFPGEILRCCIDCATHEVIVKDNSFDIIYTMFLTSGLRFFNRQTICIPNFPVDFRRFFLSRAGEPGLKCQVEVFAECTQCFISGTDVTTGAVTSIDCCFTFTLIGKLFSEVELLVPAYGYCPLPPECFPPLAVCPTIIPTGIPYPPEPGGPPPTSIVPPPTSTSPSFCTPCLECIDDLSGDETPFAHDDITTADDDNPFM